MTIHRGARLAALTAVAVLTFVVAAPALAGGSGPGARAASQAYGEENCDVIHPQDVVLIIDTSGSMGDNSTNGKTRLEWAKLSAKQLVDSLDAKGGVGGAGAHRVGVTRFWGSSASVVLALGNSSAATVKGAIDGLTSNSYTPLKAGMATGAGDMTANGRAGDVQHVLILLSDGRPWEDQGPSGTWATSSSGGQRPTAAQGSAYLGAADVRISVALGTTSGTGPNVLDLGLMALLGPEGAYHVVNGGELPDVFADIFEQITCPTEPPTTTTTTTTTEETTTDETTTEETTTEETTTEETTTEETTTEETTTTTTFTQETSGETDVPTLPPTSMAGDGPSGPSGSSWLLVAALGALLAATILLTPSRAGVRRR
jgi:von Willebrand factor type A domain